MTTAIAHRHHPRTVAQVLSAARVGVFKLLSVRGTWGFGAVAVLLAAGSAVLQFSAASGTSGTVLVSAEAADRLYRATTLTPLLVLMLAILATAGEIRHRTLSGSLLLNPRRSVWLASQALAAVIGGLLLSLMVCIAIGLLGALLAVVHGVPVVPTVVGFGSRIAGLLAVTGAYALMGTAVAAAIGEQTVAIVAALGWDLVLETLLTGALPSVAPYLPGRLAMAIMGISDGRSLPISWAAALLYGYVTAASLLGVLLFRRRDITT